MSTPDDEIEEEANTANRKIRDQLRDKIETHKMFRNNIDLEFTIAPKPPPTIKTQFSRDPRDNFIDHYQLSITNFIKPLEQYSNSFIFYPEISKKSNLHFHGKINFKDYASWLAFEVPTMCQFELKPFRESHWPDYIKKDSDMMEPFIKSLNLPYTMAFTLKVKAKKPFSKP